MIDPDPKCEICDGSGVVPAAGSTFPCFPCSCRGEPNNCDRCATLLCGEERAPSSRWEPPARGCLCLGCRKVLYTPILHVYGQGKAGDHVSLVGNREALNLLLEAVQRALYQSVPQLEVKAVDGVVYPLKVKLDETLCTGHEREPSHLLPYGCGPFQLPEGK